MSISALKKEARLSLKGYWGLGVAVTFIVFLINAGLPLVFEIPLSGGFTNWVMQDTDQTPLAASLVSLLISIILIPLGIGVIWFYVNLVRGSLPKLEEIFFVYKDWKVFLKLIWVSIVQGIFVFLWSLLLLIPGIIKGLAYSQTFYLLKDHPEYTVLEAITESRKRMVGYKWKYFLLQLSFIGWGILCLISLGIGFLWFVPYYSATMAAFYNEIIADKKDEEKELL
ncbi:DUF975 family protein [Niallia nealsonii]|uniref:Integral membrane protein n=1 Tax=Niallia nealsonii TaxID=115979 RepID=A0A2N0YYG1_9BACI|nr:DUF975 family protein [Niallia nealsonii]PKG22293.1 hypothetical protein CWS01_17835 [Niallia nealsonii]